MGDVAMTVADVVNNTSRCYYTKVTARGNLWTLMALCGTCAAFSLTEALVQPPSRRLSLRVRAFLVWGAATALAIAVDFQVFHKRALGGDSSWGGL